MPTIPLFDIHLDLVEADIQNLFDAWGDGRDAWRVFAPDWLLRCSKPQPRASFPCENFGDRYSFRPDVVWWTPEWLVMELKRNKKFEPLALAEVLHHAWHLGEQQREVEGDFPVPVVMSSGSDSAWMRASLRYLFHKGLDSSAIRYLEGNYYQTPDGQRYAWFEEPFAVAAISTHPPVIPEGWEGLGVTWRRSQTSATWIGLPDQIAHQPGMSPTEYGMVSGTEDHSEYVLFSSNGGGSGSVLWRRNE